ncbi:MAG: tetratricopeptide repeat protein [Kofleriaceae bacterium]
MKRALVSTIMGVGLWACGGRATPSAPVRVAVEKAETAEKARKHDDARRHYQAAIATAKDPASIAFARREFADTLITWGEYPEATAQLEGVTRASPSDPSAWHDLGMLYFNRGDAARAIVSLEKARSLAPEDERPRKTLAVIKWKRGDFEGARAEYRGMLELPLPEKTRASVEWAIADLTKRIAARQSAPASP